MSNSTYLSFNEKELRIKIAEGNEKAFNEFYASLLPEFAGYVIKLVKSPEAAQEVTQEALIRFWLHRSKLYKVNDIRAWFFKIIANECYRYLRKHGLDKLKMQITGEISLSNAIQNEGRQTDADVAFREIQQAIQQIVSKLSPRQKTVFRLSREEGLTLPEIAKVLGVSRDYVKKTLMTALKIIKDKLTEAGLFLICIHFYKYFF